MDEDHELLHAEFLCAEVDKAFDVLMEWFDAAQFVATFVDDNGTTHLMSRGRGNYYSRIGSVQEWLGRDAADTTATALGEVLNGEEGESGFD